MVDGHELVETCVTYYIRPVVFVFRAGIVEFIQVAGFEKGEDGVHALVSFWGLTVIGIVPILVVGPVLQERYCGLRRPGFEQLYGDVTPPPLAVDGWLADRLIRIERGGISVAIPGTSDQGFQAGLVIVFGAHSEVQDVNEHVRALV